MRHITAADDFALYHVRTAILIGLQKINRLTLIQGKEQLLRDRIISVVLLQDLEMAAGVERTQDHGIGLKVSGDVGDLQVIYSWAQIEWELLS